MLIYLGVITLEPDTGPIEPATDLAAPRPELPDATVQLWYNTPFEAGGPRFTRRTNSRLLGEHLGVGSEAVKVILSVQRTITVHSENNISVAEGGHGDGTDGA